MTTSTQRVLVTGGAGFIGSHLVDALAERGHEVTVVDDLSAGSRLNLIRQDGNPRVRLEVSDVLDKTRLQQLLVGVDTVFHLATIGVRVSLFDPEVVHQVNALGTLNVLRASVEARVRRFVYLSSSEVYGSARQVPMSEDHPFDPQNVYGASKLTGELYARVFHRTHGLSTVVVRPFNAYGARSHFEGPHGEVIPKFVVRVLNGLRPIIFGDGAQTRDFTHVDDSVSGVLLAAERGNITGQAVNVGRGREVSIAEVARIVLAACGRNDIEPEYRPERPADVRRHLADITLARRLGYSPVIDLEDGIRQYVEWVRATYANLRTLLEKEQPCNWQQPVHIGTHH